MSTKTRAEELAERLESRNGNASGFGLGPVCDEAAAELRRLAGAEAERAILQRKVSEQALAWLSLDEQARELMTERDRLSAEVSSLRSEVEALRADAGRYRWLRDKADFLRLQEGSPQVCITDPWGLLVSVARDTYPTGQRLDAAIDAAMAGSSKP